MKTGLSVQLGLRPGGEEQTTKKVESPDTQHQLVATDKELRGGTAGGREDVYRGERVLSFQGYEGVARENRSAVNTAKLHLAFGGNSSVVNTAEVQTFPHRPYVESVIETAQKDIHEGENVDRNKRLVNLMGKLIHEDPQQLVLEAKTNIIV